MTLIANGLLGVDEAATSCVAALPTLIGVGLGQRLRGHIPQKIFNRLLLALLFVIGLNLIRRGLF